MLLHVLNSSSAGNGYILETKDTALIIEAGVHLKEVKKALAFNLRKIAGCIITHSHGDHAGYARRYAQDAAIDVYASQGTLQELSMCDRPHTHRLLPMQSVHIGEFTVSPFPVEHDTSEPMGFIIDHPESGRILFVTDTMYLKYNFRSMGLSHMLLETNYDARILEENVRRGAIDQGRAMRTINSHMEIDTALKIIDANLTEHLRTVVLIHLSDHNSDEIAFMASARAHAPLAQVYAADANLTLKLDKFPI